MDSKRVVLALNLHILDPLVEGADLMALHDRLTTRLKSETEAWNTIIVGIVLDYAFSRAFNMRARA